MPVILQRNNAPPGNIFEYCDDDIKKIQLLRQMPACTFLRRMIP